MKGERLLQHALNIFETRRAEYGEANVLFHEIAKRWSLTLGKEIRPAEVVLCLLELKLARLTQDNAHQDSITDIAGYAAVLAEITGDSHGR